MAKQARTSFANNHDTVIEAMKTLASGKNPDGTDYTLPAEQAALGPNDHVDIGTVGGLDPMRRFQILPPGTATSTSRISATIDNRNNKGFLLVMQISVAGAASGGISPVMQVGVDEAESNWVDVHAAPAPVNTVGANVNSHVYWFAPQAPAVAGKIKGSVTMWLPTRFRFLFYHADATSFTYSAYGQMF